MQNTRNGNFGIVVSGGPAPGINTVISAAVLEASRHGYATKGLVEGFKNLTLGRPGATVELPVSLVSSIYNQGGSILGTSRFNPCLNAESQERFLAGLAAAQIDKLIVVGGEGSAYLSLLLSRRAPHLAVAHVPKTIDNDLVLPHHYPSFGFETARYAGAKILDTLSIDARTCKRWFIVTTMGRNAGFLALGLGVSSGATLTLIPEEFAPASQTPRSLAEVIFASMQQRCAEGKEYGLALLAEGLLDSLNPDSSPTLRSCARDEMGRIKYSRLELGEVLMPELNALCDAARLPIKSISKNIGYELRCYPPISFDVEYCRFLGLGAVRALLEGQCGVLITRDYDRLSSQPLETLIDAGGHIASRRVNLTSDTYLVARSFMVRPLPGAESAKN